MFSEQLVLHDRKFLSRVEKLKRRLDFCGTKGVVSSFCKKCETPEKPSVFIGDAKTVFTCHIKYCDKSHDVIQRVSAVSSALKNVKRFENLNNLLHLEFGFAWINKKDFVSKTKQFKRVINDVFHKLRRLGHKFDYVACIDFIKHENDMIFVHFHYGLTPIPKVYYRKFLVDLKLIEAVLNRNKKIESNNFHSQSFGYKPIKSVLNYISKRSMGLYKKHEGNPKYKHLKGVSLEEQLKEEYYYLLKDIFTLEEYSEMLYNKRFLFSSKGIRLSLPNGSNKSSISYQNICPVHGELERCDLRLVFVWYPNGFDPPPEILKEDFVCDPVRVEEIVIHE